MFWVRNPMMGRTAGGGGGSMPSISFFNSATATGNSVTLPASLQDDTDLGVYFDWCVHTAIPTDVVPSGWTGITTEGLVSARLRVSYKLLTAAEASSSVAGMTQGDVLKAKVVLVFRGSSALTTITPSTWNKQTTGSNPTLQTVSAAGQPGPLIVLGMAGATITASFSTESPAFTATVAPSGTDLIVGYKIYNSSPQNHSIDTGDNGINSLASGFLKVA